MPDYVNIGGKLCVNTKEFGYVSVQDYLAIREISRTEEMKEAPQTINANTTLILNKHQHFLSKEEVLDVFVQYIHKYRNSYRSYDIPVGIKYLDYSDYIYKELHRVFPDIRWKLLHATETQFMVRGETI